jgi:colanic acid/amylovoran biosynthesis glycosyltransferase
MMSLLATSLPKRDDKDSCAATVGYVLKRFPSLSQTFILNEILELEREGVALEIFSLLEPNDALRHDMIRHVRGPVTYLPHDFAAREWMIREERCRDGTVRERRFEELVPGEEGVKASSLRLKAVALAALAPLRGVRHLHAHFGTAATTVAMLAGQLTGIPYSFTAHAKDIYHESVDRALLTQKIRRANFVVTVSDYNRQHLAAVAGEALAGKILRLYNGIDLTRFRPDPAIEREASLILAVGRLVEKKGLVHLVHACRLLADWKSSFRCLIVGDGPERPSLSERIGALGLNDRVILMGAHTQEWLLETLKRATMLVLPSVVSAAGDRDGLPTVLLEALGVGLPAISTAVAGIPEIIDHEETGLLVPPADPERLARAIQALLTRPALRQRLGRQGRSRAEDAFDIRKNAAVLRDLFGRTAVDHALLQPAMK